MSPLISYLSVAWGVLTALLVVLLIYRSTLTMHEDDQLFLNSSETHMAKEQADLMVKMDRMGPALRWLGAASGMLILVIAGLWVYEGLTRVQ
ncbi:MAG TPA: hypothetical protein VG892_07010 [Terriglobales bacterium]|jgi:hypothetical protein|nr:hypothetical protein [Terriglobales bacterium]